MDKSDSQLDVCVHRERCNTQGYAEAIPIDDLVDLARQCASLCDDCATRSDIEREVRSRLCPCILCEECIVNAVVEEVYRTRGNFIEASRTGCDVSIRVQNALLSTQSK